MSDAILRLVRKFVLQICNVSEELATVHEHVVAKRDNQVYLTEVICCMNLLTVKPTCATIDQGKTRGQKRRPSVGWQTSCRNYFQLLIKTL